MVKPSKSSRDWSFRIKDILQAIDSIEQYTKNMTVSEFKKNKLVVDAVIRNFEIIGEASVHIPDAFRSAHPDVPWKQMTAMRNILIHEKYAFVSLQPNLNFCNSAVEIFLVSLVYLIRFDPILISAD